MNTLLNQFKQQSIFYMKENLPRIKKCLEKITEEEVWKKPNENTNSIGNLLLHLCGNITQYIISCMGGDADSRIRESEFSTKGGFTKQELLEKITGVVSKAISVIKNVNEEKLIAQTKVQGFDMTGVDIIIHVVEHFSYHTGQIALLTKLFINKDLGFYAGVNLNIKNK